MEKKHLVKSNFWEAGLYDDPNIYDTDLGWDDYIKKSAQTDYPQYIFRYVVEIVGNNILFYWTKDENFYTIETEKSPIEVRRISLNPNWDGKCEFTKAGTGCGPSTASTGEIIATFESPTQIWDGLKIDGVPIGKVLEQSLIIDLD